MKKNIPLSIITFPVKLCLKIICFLVFLLVSFCVIILKVLAAMSGIFTSLIGGGIFLLLTIGLLMGVSNPWYVYAIGYVLSALILLIPTFIIFLLDAVASLSSIIFRVAANIPLLSSGWRKSVVEYSPTLSVEPQPIVHETKTVIVNQYIYVDNLDNFKKQNENTCATYITNDSDFTSDKITIGKPEKTW